MRNALPASGGEVVACIPELDTNTGWYELSQKYFLLAFDEYQFMLPALFFG